MFILALTSAIFLCFLIKYLFFWVYWGDTALVIAKNIIYLYGAPLVFFVVFLAWQGKLTLRNTAIFKLLPMLAFGFSFFVLLDTLLTQNISVVLAGLDHGLWFGVTLFSTFTWGIFFGFTLLYAQRKGLSATDAFGFSAVSFLFLNNVWELPVEIDFLWNRLSWYFAGFAFLYLAWVIGWRPSLLFEVNLLVCALTLLFFKYIPIMLLRVPFAFVPLTLIKEAKIRHEWTEH
jgi:hypothetical protein